MNQTLEDNLKVPKKIAIRNHVLAYLLVFFDTVFFPDVFEEVLYSSVFVLLFIYFILKKKKIKKNILIAFLITFTILLLQTAYFGIFNTPSAINIFIRLLYPYIIIRIIGLDYIKYFVNIIYIICIISFVFYFSSLLVPGAHNLIHRIVFALNVDVVLNQNFIIYTWEDFHLGYLRNSGNFTEPGFFASMLLLAITFNLINTKTLFNKKMYVFVIALLTTLSTAGYIGLFTIIFIFFLFKSRSTLKYITIPIFIYASYFIYTEMHFLQEKIENRYEDEVIEGGTIGRFGSTLGSLNDFMENPIIGRGLLKQTRFDGLSDYYGVSPYSMMNSITNTLVRYGAVGFSVLLILFVSSVKYLLKAYNCSKYYFLIIVSVVIIACISQPVLFTPIYVSLFLAKDISPYRLAPIEKN